MKKVLLLTIIAALFINTTAFAGNVNVNLSADKPINASLRSALIPGWGQLWNEQPTKSAIVFIVFGASLAGALYYNNEADEKYKKYKNTGMVNGDYYDKYETAYNTSKIFTYVTIAAWVYGVVDAYFICKKRINDAPKTTSFNIYYDTGIDGMFFTYSKKI